MFRYKIILFFIFFYSLSAKAQLDLEHWLPPINWFVKGGSPELFESKIYLSTPHEIPFLVKLFSGNTVIKSFMLSKSSPVVYDLRSEVFFSNDNFLFQKVTRGLHIAGENSFYASYRISSGRGDEVITSKGKTAIGKQFFIGAAPSNIDEFGFGNIFTSIYATKDDTHILIKNKQLRTIFADGEKHSEFKITLNKGESYSIKVSAKDNFITDFSQNPYAYSNEVYNSLIGAEITADQPVAVLNGNDSGQIAFDNFKNLLYDQTIPVKNIGTEYFIRSGFSTLRALSEGALIIATEDNTKVYFNGESAPIILNKGQFYSTILSNPNKFIEHDPSNDDLGRNVGFYVKASAKIYCYQFTGGTANQSKGIYFSLFCESMDLVLPLDATIPGTIDFVPKFSKIGNRVSLDARLNILLPTGQIPSLNDVLVGNSTGPFNIKGTDSYKYFQVKIPKNTVEDLKISSSSGLILNILTGFEGLSNSNFDDSSQGFASHYTGFSNDPFILVNGNCIQEDVLLSLNNVDFEGFQWQLNGDDIPGANLPNFKPVTPGLYNCILSYSTFTYATEPVQVADCPYVISDLNLGNICPDFTIKPKFSAPNENLKFVKLEILTQPNYGIATITDNEVKVTNNPGFSGSDRVVYKITAANGFYEVVKADFFIFVGPVADLKSEIYNTVFEDPNYIYNLSSAINNVNDEKFHYYNSQSDAEEDNRKIFNLLAFKTENPTQVFVKIISANGCSVVKTLKLLKTPIPPPVEVTLYNVFTPNDDGFNDSWDYSLLSEYGNLKLAIYDRFGKLIFERKSDNESFFWNGKDALGRSLPTSTYWVTYSYTLKDIGSQISKSMWLVIKNRD